MDPFKGEDPARFIVEFCGGFERAVTDTEEDLATIVDRFHTPGMEQTNDGLRMDRSRLIAHLRPIRKNRPSSRLEVHEATSEGDLLTARYTMHVTTKRKAFSIDVHFFGRFASDGRLREAHSLTRMEKNAGAPA
ncbi:nuclear transport factor 2 family protein [Nocardiopsis sp. L17-MgMaSL7]|uniref:nuclear transport factor 2 family protein n=1 Tax=Nocardiopsis sp. L17-MgMaSL7 TaxID=1938893 RepID=UPI000D8AC851|nr:nuclear transport factor 2 family protein [Nocardiopsis sp. L17-MgMaSL7]PWV54728.1 SnoaL-like protein [Nocardiopsis sp. L17-MgMaSL7]